jgi:glycosyltransferase XagB
MSASSQHLRLVRNDFVPTAGLPSRGLRTGARDTRRQRKPLGQILLDMKAVQPEHLARALSLRDRQDVRLGDILLANDWVVEADLMAALAHQWAAQIVDLLAIPPDVRLLDRFGADFCLAEGMIPWRRNGSAIVIATARPEDFSRLRARLPLDCGPVIMALAPERDIHAALVAARQTSLTRRAEARVAPHESCRSLDGARIGRQVALPLAAFAMLAVVAPSAAFAVLFSWAVLSLLFSSGFKALAFANSLRHHFNPPPQNPPLAIARLPIVSVMVPLFHEDDIAPRLINRLEKLDYPRELLDVLLVVEEDDHRTRTALAASRLPRWMRVISVPDGPIRTKPRALNYALDFCRGSIIGVYDAEDAPEPNQLRAVVHRFHERGPEVACLQGILDFYNSSHNWLSRCFAIEYAAWFRVTLPGIARLGYVVPLGGTTLFFRRKVLEELGGWDAHNVTEDADLGLRLARHGYRTELIETVTEEEPNARMIPWIKQRSRWLKGFAMTWAVHMRDPALLWRQLGAKRFIGVQILFLGCVSQYALAPVLWSFWALALGFGHPMQGFLPKSAILACSALFVLAELLNYTVGLWAVRGPKHRHLSIWVPGLHLYFPIGALAAYKALWEMARRPFFWDKTCHGVLDGAVADEAAQAPADMQPANKQPTDKGVGAQHPAPARPDVLRLENPILPERALAAPRPASLATPAKSAAAVNLHKILVWSHPAPRLVAPVLEQAPEACHRLGRSVAGTAPRIEFQPRFEGF